MGRRQVLARLALVALACAGVAIAQPAITLSNPSAGASVSMPGTVTVSATVTPASGTVIASVSFYQGSVLLSQVTAAPYSISWSPLTPGTYSLQAVALDSAGLSASSAIVSVTALAPTTVGQVSYSYDPSGRIAGIAYGGLATESFSFDGSSNLTSAAFSFVTVADWRSPLVLKRAGNVALSVALPVRLVDSFSLLAYAGDSPARGLFAGSSRSSLLFSR